MKIIFKMLLMSTLTTYALQAHSAIQPEITGGIDLVSQYVSRGLTNSPENDKVALQVSLNASFDQFYLFYWGSTLNYSFKEIQTGQGRGAEKIEHDFGAGYNFDALGWNIDIWDAIYYYQGGKNTTANELGITFSKALTEKSSVGLAVTTFLYDVVYMNQWDTYLQLHYTYQINDKVGSAFTAGASYFNNDGQYEGQDFLDTQTDFSFRFALAELNYLIHPNVTAYSQFIYGGHDRSDIKQKNQVLFGLNYAF